jgi:hypothetical protein
VNASPPLTAGVDRALHTRRCARHVEREAAVRCPECTRFFCRECVVEHAGRLLCVDCLARATAQSGTRRREWKRVRSAATLMAAFGVAWLVFYGIGALLLKFPPAFHEGGRPASSRHPS